jgi:hypothetical protein
MLELVRHVIEALGGKNVEGLEEELRLERVGMKRMAKEISALQADRDDARKQLAAIIKKDALKKWGLKKAIRRY